MEMDNFPQWFQWLKSYIREAVQNRFYGKITLSFEAGRLVHIKREENIKPPT